MRTFDGYKKGVNLGGWISQCVSYEKEHFETFITEDDIKTISQWVLDHVKNTILTSSLICTKQKVICLTAMLFTVRFFSLMTIICSAILLICGLSLQKNTATDRLTFILSCLMKSPLLVLRTNGI